MEDILCRGFVCPRVSGFFTCVRIAIVSRKVARGDHDLDSVSSQERHRCGIEFNFVCGDLAGLEQLGRVRRLAIACSQNTVGHAVGLPIGMDIAELDHPVSIRPARGGMEDHPGVADYFQILLKRFASGLIPTFGAHGGQRR